MTTDLDGKGMICPRCDALYKQLKADSFCLRCWNTHVNVAVTFVELRGVFERDL